MFEVTASLALVATAWLCLLLGRLNTFSKAFSLRERKSPFPFPIFSHFFHFFPLFSFFFSLFFSSVPRDRTGGLHVYFSVMGLTTLEWATGSDGRSGLQRRKRRNHETEKKKTKRRKRSFLKTERGVSFFSFFLEKKTAEIFNFAILFGLLAGLFSDVFKKSW